MTQLVLDLYCGQGGAAKGYSDAGMTLIGVDIKPQPRYPFTFHRAESWKVLYKLIHDPPWRGYELDDFALIHASPPCQAYSDLQARNRVTYQPLIRVTRRLLVTTNRLYVIEKSESAPLLDPTILCGTMFPGLRVIRHRKFETNWPLKAPKHPSHPLVYTFDRRKSHYKQGNPNTDFV